MVPIHHAAPPTHAIVTRLLLPDDANLAGNVHGGTILQRMDEACVICAPLASCAPSSSGNAEPSWRHWFALETC